MPVISQSLGPTRKRCSVSAVGLAPMRVAVTVLPSALVSISVGVPPSPTVPGIAASIMQLVTSV